MLRKLLKEEKYSREEIISRKYGNLSFEKDTYLTFQLLKKLFHRIILAGVENEIWNMY